VDYVDSSKTNVLSAAIVEVYYSLKCIVNMIFHFIVWRYSVRFYINLVVKILSNFKNKILIGSNKTAKLQTLFAT